jgi:hypothetical protein
MVLKITWMGRWVYAFLICFALGLYAMMPAVLHAQQAGSITGTVLDSSSGALPKATVVLHRNSGTVSRQVTSDNGGRFAVDGLPPGTYTIDVSAQGFTNIVRDGVIVKAGQSVPLSLQPESVHRLWPAF